MGDIYKYSSFVLILENIYGIYVFRFYHLNKCPDYLKITNIYDAINGTVNANVIFTGSNAMSLMKKLRRFSKFINKLPTLGLIPTGKILKIKLHLFYVNK